jgi:hypothetical protein
LSGGITYHFRLVASNSTGTSYGGDATFTTESEGDEAELIISCFIATAGH